MDEDGQASAAGADEVRICGSRLLLRAFQPGEVEAEWQAMADADPMTIAELPDEASFRARLQRSGHLADGWLDLAIDLDGVPIGRIQTFVPAGRPLHPGTFEVGIGLRASARSGMSGRLWRIVGRAFAERGSSPIMKRISARTRMSSASQARGDITNRAWPSDALASPL